MAEINTLELLRQFVTNYNPSKDKALAQELSMYFQLKGDRVMYEGMRRLVEASGKIATLERLAKLFVFISGICGLGLVVAIVVPIASAFLADVYIELSFIFLLLIALFFLLVVSGHLTQVMLNRKYSLLAGIIPSFVERVELSQELLQKLLERAKQWHYSEWYGYSEGYTWNYGGNDERWRKRWIDDDVATDPAYRAFPLNIYHDR